MQRTSLQALRGRCIVPAFAQTQNFATSTFEIDGLAAEILTFADLKDVLGLGQFLDIRDRFKQTGP